MDLFQESNEIQINYACLDVSYGRHLFEESDGKKFLMHAQIWKDLFQESEYLYNALKNISS